jgi:uncharacterized membrane protein YkoI
MKQRKQLGGLVTGCLIVLTLAVSVWIASAWSQNAKDSRAAVSADQAIACVRTAVTAKAGDVRSMEVDNEDGKLICEMEILAQDGKSYEVEVDVASNTVTDVEEDND